MMNKTALATGERTILNQCSMGETVTIFLQGKVINGACEHMCGWRDVVNAEMWRPSPVMPAGAVGPELWSVLQLGTVSAA